MSLWSWPWRVYQATMRVRSSSATGTVCSTAGRARLRAWPAPGTSGRGQRNSAPDHAATPAAAQRPAACPPRCGGAPAPPGPRDQAAEGSRRRRGETRPRHDQQIQQRSRSASATQAPAGSPAQWTFSTAGASVFTRPGHPTSTPSHPAHHKITRSLSTSQPMPARAHLTRRSRKLRKPPVVPGSTGCESPVDNPVARVSCCG